MTEKKLSIAYEAQNVKLYIHKECIAAVDFKHVRGFAERVRKTLDALWRKRRRRNRADNFPHIIADKSVDIFGKLTMPFFSKHFIPLLEIRIKFAVYR